MTDDNKDYCVHCANEDGSMHTFEQQKERSNRFWHYKCFSFLQETKR